MRLFSAARLAVLAAALLAVLGVFAGVSSGSASFVPAAQTPRLLAHDTSSFTPAGAHPATVRRGLPGPQLWTTRRNTARRLFSASTLLNIAGATTSAQAANANGDIGLTQYMQAVDGEYSVYSRTGALLGAVTNTAFWSGLGGPDGAGLCATHPQGQASVVYDRVADRFVVAEAAFSGAVGNAGGPFDECIAVSSTGDATGTWYRYVFQISTSLYPDMPSLGVWSDGYYLSFNQSTSSGSWAGVGVVAFQRSAMLGSSAATARYFNMQNTIGIGGMLPASNGGVNAPASGPELFLQAHEDLVGTNDHLELWGFHADFAGTGSTFQPLAQIPVSSFSTGFACSTDACVSQEVGGNVPFLDTISRAHVTSSEALPQLGGQLMYGHNGSLETLAVAHTVVVGPLAGVRWYRLQNSGSGWSVSTSGTFSPSTSPIASNRFIPAAAFDNLGEVALGYARTGDGYAGPSLDYTEATSASPGDVQVADGGAAHGSSTWGRSMSVRLDPIGLCQFWMTGPAAGADNSWSTRIVAFSFSGCSPSASQPTLTSDPTWSSTLVREGQTITGTAAGFSGASSTTDAWQRCDSAGMNCVDIPGETGTSHTMTATDAAGDRTLRFTETATNSYGASTAVSTATPVVQSIPPVNTAVPVITGTAATNNLISADNGTWTSSSPLTFTYRWRRCAADCTDIAGATASTYTPTTDDVGSTLDVVVSATNTGGGTDVVAAETATVVVGAAPSTPTTTTTTTTTTATATTPTTVTSTSGVETPPDLQLGVTASPGSAPIGQRVTLYYTVTDKNKQPARNLKVTLTLPSGLAYAGAYAERGPGCVASGTQVVCSLDYVSALTPVTRVQVYVTVKDSSAQTVSATATSTESDASPSDNTASIAVGSGSATTSTVSGTTAPPPILGPDGMPVGLNGTSSKSAAGVDTHAPTARALASSGRRGTSASLKFRIYDDSGVARAAATIERNGRKVGSVQTGFGPVAAGSVYFVAWHVPAKTAKGKYTFCVVASDRSRHSSKQSCAPLTVR